MAYIFRVLFQGYKHFPFDGRCVFFRCWWVNQVEWLKKLLSGSILRWTTNKEGFWIVFGSWWKLWILKDMICVIHWDGWHCVRLQNVTAKKDLEIWSALPQVGGLSECQSEVLGKASVSKMIFFRHFANCNDINTVKYIVRWIQELPKCCAHQVLTVYMAFFWTVLLRPQFKTIRYMGVYMCPGGGIPHLLSHWHHHRNIYFQWYYSRPYSYTVSHTTYRKFTITWPHPVSC